MLAILGKWRLVNADAHLFETTDLPPQICQMNTFGIWYKYFDLWSGVYTFLHGDVCRPISQEEVSGESGSLNNKITLYRAHSSHLKNVLHYSRSLNLLLTATMQLDVCRWSVCPKIPTNIFILFITCQMMSALKDSFAFEFIIFWLCS